MGGAFVRFGTFRLARSESWILRHMHTWDKEQSVHNKHAIHSDDSKENKKDH